MTLTNKDIGAEIISILTRGMYPDPRDAVREYIQNGIDANATDLEVKVRQNSVVVEDNGHGMDYNTLRKALRIGVSDKRPGKDVGFMGIGIYSAFHLCDELTIYTKKKKKLPQVLKMNFKGMRVLLEDQKEKRFNKEITSKDLTDLQTLLELHIELPEKGDITDEEYPVEQGTRVEIVGLNPVLDDVLKDFDDLAGYLQTVVPLHFDKENFKWGKYIENEIGKICKEHNSKFELINLKLQVGIQTKHLYRPYLDDEFNYNEPLSPVFIPIKDADTFYGVAWGSLNTYDKALKAKKIKIADSNLRGFLLRKQGFAIGKREDLAKYFGKSKTHFDRYTGEIIIINNKILPNAARNDIEISILRSNLLKLIQSEIAPKFVSISNNYQEEEKAKEVLRIQGNTSKKLRAEYNPNEDNYNVYLEQIREIDDVINAIKKKTNKLNGEDIKEAQRVIKSSEKLKRDILLSFDKLTSGKKKRKGRKSTKDTKKEVSDDLENYNVNEVTLQFESLLDLVESLDIEYSEEMKILLFIMDEELVQALAKNDNNYYKILNQLKENYENNLPYE